MLTDPATGAVLDVGSAPARPARRPRRGSSGSGTACAGSPAAAGRPAGCDLDHTVARTRTGQTSAENLHALCRRHHRLPTAHEAGWQVTAEPGSRLEWTSPLGAVYTTDPPDPGDEARTQRAPADPPDEGEPDVREPDPGWPWEDFDDDLHRWLDDPAAA